jgi:hypothetical protein
VFEHGLESRHVCEHGKQQGIEIASDVPSVFRSKHFDVGVIWLNDSREGLLLKLDELDGLVCVACGIPGPQGQSYDFLVLGYLMMVEFFEALRDDVDLLALVSAAAPKVE